MKKLFLILALVLGINASYADETEGFKNPLFYKTLHGMATKGSTITITPTQYHIRNAYGYETSAKCELLENEKDKVVLKCLHLPSNSGKKELIIVRPGGIPTFWIYKFIIPSQEQQVYKNGQKVILYPRLSWEKEDEAISYENYIIYTSEQD